MKGNAITINCDSLQTEISMLSTLNLPQSEIRVVALDNIQLRVKPYLECVMCEFNNIHTSNHYNYNVDITLL